MSDRYSPGDRVFAKLKGYQAWPARVMERVPLRAETYKVYFYGTYQECNIKPDLMFDYNEENVSKFSSAKAMKKQGFMKGMEEIAADLGIHEKGAEPEPMGILPQGSTAPAEEESDDNEGELLIDEGPMTPIPTSRRESRPPTLTPAPQMPKMTPAPPRMTPAPVQKGTTGGPTPRGSLGKVTPIPPLKQAPIMAAKLAESAEVTPPVKQGRRGSKGKKDLAAAAGTATPPPAPVVDTTPQPEIVSRSGRKIKPKRFADDELPVSAAAAAAKGTSGDEAKGSEGPPPSKRTRRRASQGVPALVPATKTSGKHSEVPATPPVPVPPVPTLIQKPKLTPAPTIPTRGRTRLSSSEATISVTPVVDPPAVPTLRARPGTVLPTAPPKRNRSTSAHVAEKLAGKSTRGSKTPIVQEPADAAEEAEVDLGQASSPLSEDEEVLGLTTPREDDVEDKENNENSLSAEEAQWMENGGEEGEVESGEGDGEELDEDGEGDDDSEDPDDPLNAVRKLPVAAKNGVDVELTYDEDRPEEFETESARVEWDLATARNVLKIRSALEKDEFAATNFLAEVARAVETKEEELKELVSVKTKEKVLRKIHQLRMEGEMIEIIGEIVGCLGQKEHDLDRALEFLERLSTHELNPLLLKKHPEFPQTISKLRRFVGDPERFNYNAAQREDLKLKAGLIRAKACAIYMNLKVLFCLNPDQPFMPTFNEKVKKFNEAVAHLPEKSVLGLVVDPTEKIEKQNADEEAKSAATSDDKDKLSPSEQDQETNTETEASASASEAEENKNADADADASSSPAAVTGDTETDEQEESQTQSETQMEVPRSPSIGEGEDETTCEKENI